MGLTRWGFPTTIIFAIGAVNTVAEHAKRLGASRVLVVCDAGVVRTGIAGQVERLLEAGGVSAVLFDKVDPNPVERNVFDGVAAYREAKAEAIVSVGGGS